MSTTPSELGATRATFGQRLGGHLLDSLFYGLLVALVVGGGIALMALAAKDCLDRATDAGTESIRCQSGEVNLPLLFLGILVIAIGVMAVLFLYCRALGRSGQTFGRGIVGIRVVDEATGATIGLPRAVGRTLFAHIVSSALCGLGYLWMLWDPQQQTWHDKVAHTVVVRE